MVSKMQSPAAVEARGASEIDQLGGRVVSEHSLSRTCSQAIHAELIGSDSCHALGINVRGHAPVFTLCRALIEAGHDPAQPLEAWRGDVLALKVRSIGEGAELTVQDDRLGGPRLRRVTGLQSDVAASMGAGSYGSIMVAGSAAARSAKPAQHPASRG
jgi:hypothetical protein